MIQAAFSRYDGEEKYLWERELYRAAVRCARQKVSFPQHLAFLEVPTSHYCQGPAA